MVDKCYHKVLTEKRVIHIREALQLREVMDYRRCPKCNGYNINCQYYITPQQQRARGLEALEVLQDV